MNSQGKIKTIYSLQDELSTSKVRFLILLLNYDRKDATITHIAKVIGVSKSTISRMVDWFENKNLAVRTNNRAIVLTNIGRDMAQEFEHRRETLRKWLLEQGLDHKVAEEDSINMVHRVSPQFIERIERLVKCSDIKEKYSEYTAMTGDELCRVLGDGIYDITFVIYKFKVDQLRGLVPSMANDGLEKNGELRIKNNEGLIVLRSKNIEHVSLMGGLVLNGRLTKLKYQENGKFKDSAREGDTFYFPASFLNFINIGNNRILQGSGVLKMAPSVGSVHMPESTCIFTVYF